jgi:hypothetical protein
MHQTCYISISSSDKLAKAQQRKKKESEISQYSSHTSSPEMPACNAVSDDEAE